jgi:hypothetical protein
MRAAIIGILTVVALASPAAAQSSVWTLAPQGTQARQQQMNCMRQVEDCYMDCSSTIWRTTPSGMAKFNTCERKCKTKTEDTCLSKVDVFGSRK